MFQRITKLFRRPVPPEPPMERLRHLAAAYDERGGDGDTLQGALANAIVAIRSEANRNGLANWGESYEECVGLLLKYLCEDPTGLPRAMAEELRKDLTVIREMGVGSRPVSYKEVDRVAVRVLEWCEGQRQPIYKPSEQGFW